MIDPSNEKKQKQINKSEVNTMKKFLKVISSKKALYVIMILAAIGNILEIVTAFRVEGYRIDYYGFGIVWACIACWAASISTKEKKEKEENEA